MCIRIKIILHDYVMTNNWSQLRNWIHTWDYVRCVWLITPLLILYFTLTRPRLVPPTCPGLIELSILTGSKGNHFVRGLTLIAKSPWSLETVDTHLWPYDSSMILSAATIDCSTVNVLESQRSHRAEAKAEGGMSVIRTSLHLLHRTHGGFTCGLMLEAGFSKNQILPIQVPYQFFRFFFPAPSPYKLCPS